LKTRIFSIRWKIIALFGTSIGLAFLIVLGLIALARSLGGRQHDSLYFRVMDALRDRIGVVPLGVLAGFAVFLLIFFLLSRRAVRDLETISKTLQKISLGRFDIRIPRRRADELGEVAENINRMADRLNRSIEEERLAEQAKNELITGISHDLRTPLTSILGYLELIEKDRHRDAEDLRGFASVAYQKSLRLKKLIDDLFDYTQVRSGGLKIQPARIDLRELIVQLAEESRPMIQAAGMEFRLSAAAEPYWISADGDLLVRVFENLFSNAVRHGRDGKVIDVRLEDGREWITARVANYGPPIPAADLGRIFDRFYRAGASRSERTDGAGLGLAIAKGIVELHGGTISASSDAARTEFMIKLKAAMPITAASGLSGV
jgi:signal transduction histidine kinase